MIELEKLRRVAAVLQVVTLGLVVVGLVFRATIYWTMQPQSGAAFGSGDILDFAIALALFLTSTLCAMSGVGISLLGTQADKGLAYRVMLVGILSFLAYEFLHGRVPRLM